MKKSLIALALALTMVGTLAACSNTDKDPGNTGNNSGSTNGSGSAGQVSRRYSAGTAARDYMDDGRYSAGPDGRVYGNDGGTISRDLTQGARDIVRGAEDVTEDIGRGIGGAVRDITGSGSYSGTPSWQPDSSAMR